MAAAAAAAAVAARAAGGPPRQTRLSASPLSSSTATETAAASSPSSSPSSGQPSRRCVAVSRSHGSLNSAVERDAGLAELHGRPKALGPRRQRGPRAHTEVAPPAQEVDRAACPRIKEAITNADFQSVDLRIGLVTQAKPVPDKAMTEKRGKPTNSRTRLQLTVDIGCESRTVVSECKYVMDVEDAVGKKVLLVANVLPEEIEGVQSHGLILTGLNYDPTPMPRSFKLILPGLGKLPPGSQVLPAHVPQ
eukprot:SM000045S16305  [mRNA]  locus=s45:746050:747564:- [translate_table: standard]